MKQYIKKFVLFSSIFCALLSLFIGCRIQVAKHINWHLPEDTRILFMGASHSYRGIDAKLIDGAWNCSQPSERYLYTYIKLKHLFEANPQINTVFLECSSTDLWQNTDYKYFANNEQSFFVVAYWPLFNKDEWKVFKDCYLKTISVILSHLCDLKWYNASNYCSNLGTQAIDGDSQILDTTTVKKDFEIDKISRYGNYGYQTNYHYLRMIINFCKKQNIKLYLVGYPIYKESYFYDTNFCDSMRITKFGDVEYLDYRKLELSPQCRYDAHHLNNEGAKILTNEIKKRIY